MMRKKYKKISFSLLLSLLGIAATQAQPCTPTASTPCCGIGISNVKLGSINKSSPSSSGGYSDYTTSDTVYTSSGLSINYAITNGSGYYENILGWVDWNQNDVFDQATETVINRGMINVGSTASGTITVPQGQAAGSYRIRLAGDYGYISMPSPCFGQYAEFEDYTITVLPPVTMSYNTVAMLHPVKPYSQISAEFSNQRVLRVNIITHGNDPQLTLNALTFNNTGTTNAADVAMYRVFYGGNDSNFTNANPIAASTDINALTFSPFALASDSNHFFWLIVDVDPSATAGNKVDVGLETIEFDGNPTITIASSPAGDYTIVDKQIIPGNYAWNVYAFNGTNFSDYQGTYSSNGDLTYNSQDEWDSNTSPSDAPGYVGGTVNADNHSVEAYRKGFSEDFYTIAIPNHDDDAELLINGQLVWSHNGCCDYHPEVWMGTLNDTSEVMLRWKDFGGESIGYMEISSVVPYIDNISKDSAYSGDTLYLYGNYFYNNTIDSVQINGETVPFTIVDRYTIEAIVGCGTATNTVNLFGPYGDSSDPNPYFDLIDTWYADADADGFGDPLTSPITQCTKPTGYV
ncbi:MAG: hypothetical protein IT239_05925, partial [Bacteroidia bacterium]|nr:hypothetical protein [Bacteroidia bacterium]